jgi:hypothetical protein
LAPGSEMLLTVIVLAVVVAVLTTLVVQYRKEAQRNRLIFPQSQSLPVIVIGAVVQALCAVSTPAQIKGGLAYWTAQSGTIDLMSEQFREQQVANTQRIVEDSGKGLDEFMADIKTGLRGGRDLSGAVAGGGIDPANHSAQQAR